MAQDTAAQSQPLSAQSVANAFVKQYYEILRVSPQQVHRYYKDNSILSRPLPEGIMSSVTTMKGINDEILSFEFNDWEPKIEAVHAQDSIMGSVIVGVTGCLTGNDSEMVNFAQTFFLAPQAGGGFYVRNDILQFVEINIPSTPSSVPEVATNSPTAPLPQDPEPAEVPNSEQNKMYPTPKEASEIVKKVDIPANPDEKGVLPVTSAQKDTKKLSYASIVAKASSLPEPPVVRVLPKAVPPAPPKSSALPAKASAAHPNSGGLKNSSVNTEGYEIAPKAIHIKDLPSDLTNEALLKEVKKFGAVKPKSIQIREYREDGYRYAFVEFESANSARSAVEVGEISFGERKLEIQYKISSIQGGDNQGRSKSSRGGFRNDSATGHDGKGRGSSYDDLGQPRGSNMRNAPQDQAPGGSATVTNRSGESYRRGSTILVG